MVGTLLQKTVGRTSTETIDEGPAKKSLDFQQTIPRSLVHRAAVSEVFVTDLNILGPHRFEVGAQWPRRHGFFGPATPSSHDPLLYTETCRQAAMLLAHRAYGVPLGYNFLSDHKSFAIGAAGLATDCRPVNVELQVSAHDVQYRGKNVGGMRFEFDVFRDGTYVGNASERWRCVSSAVYRRVRGDHFAATPFQVKVRPTVEPAEVGRHNTQDVLVAATDTPGAWSLQFDPDHPVLFDHTVDHVPGMVVAEAARQASLLTVADPHALPLRAEFEFHSYLEFDAECLIVGRELGTAGDGTRLVQVDIQQRGKTAVTATLAMRLS
ncbi:ScbA/BarX family gamma-butyrolactone biosynthesis protein [Amycolatopsis rhabdoformis]|uniref:ScbA/BarX family gamma-butyrolactone biosynthesis protein n=1 Tax=Amycolatopsis rhabdoformis TaxID=1448059 RepID=A0ABZ1HXW7_9PSEU|nr:ScbA/BarX family gamma-butyrolactone biosynthesis protein [Amycolatopsis rhabdoformis]WSE26402.1 ScbA/BarX family gamma-butyrolactone biosynthesis protein [Amycolatopsis rhabdoformis]